MSVVQTQLPQPTARDSRLSKTDYNWLLLVQSLLPLVTVDTTGGNVVIALPDPGVAASGQTAQNMEITYRKISADVNTVTIKGSADGSFVLTAGDGSAASIAKFKSDGTRWWKTG
jgi:hypothetical protein